MSHINFDFLTESFLFGYGLEDNFSALSDYELEKEFGSDNVYERYRLRGFVGALRALREVVSWFLTVVVGFG